MPALMVKRSSSAMLNKIRREFDRRRKAVNVAKGGVGKKSSAAPLPPPSVSGAGAPKEGLPPRRSALIPFAMKVGVPNKSTATTALIRHEAAATKLSSHETTRAETEHIKKPSSAPIQPRSSSISVKKGMTVKVRGPARTLRTGQRVVILHPAVVVSDVEDGYLEVVYIGNYPRDGIVRIALDQVKKKMTPTK